MSKNMMTCDNSGTLVSLTYPVRCCSLSDVVCVWPQLYYWLQMAIFGLCHYCAQWMISTTLICTHLLMSDAIGWKVSSVLLEVQISVICFSSSDMYGLFFTHSVSKTPKIEIVFWRLRGSSVWEILWLQRNLWITRGVEFSVCAIATYYWNQTSCLWISNKDMKFIIVLANVLLLLFLWRSGTRYSLARENASYFDF